MSSTNVDLGNVEYVYLDNTRCNNGSGAADASLFTWDMPYINPNQSPIMFLQISQVLIDYTGTGKIGNADQQHLRYANVFGQNFYGPIYLAAMLELTATPAGAEDHYKNMTECPMVQVPTSLSTISFTINNANTGDPHTIGASGSVSILLKIVRPHQGIITKNIMSANVKTF